MTPLEFRKVVMQQMQQDTMENVIQEVKSACDEFFRTRIIPNTSKGIFDSIDRQLGIRALLNQAAIESKGL